MLTSQEVINWFNLTPNEAEGGYFAGTYTSKETLSKSDIPICSAIYYFLDKDNNLSTLHKVETDMVYHFYAGQPVEMLLLYPDCQPNQYEICTFSNDIANGGKPMKVIPGGTWIGSRIIPGGAFSLMGVTMSPGFDPNNYSIGNRAKLIKQYPDLEALIIAFTKEPVVTTKKKKRKKA